MIDHAIAFVAVVTLFTAILAVGGVIFRAAWRRFIGPAE
jgi:hypothetical protein